MHIGQAEVPASVAIGQLLMFQSHKVQDGCMQVMDVHAVFDGVVAELIRRPVDKAGLHPAFAQFLNLSFHGCALASKIFWYSSATPRTPEPSA